MSKLLLRLLKMFNLIFKELKLTITTQKEKKNEEMSIAQLFWSHILMLYLFFVVFTGFAKADANA